MRLIVLLLLSLLATVAAAAQSDYVGVLTCAECHTEQYLAWRGSHHDLAMQRPREATVLGDFEDAIFEYGGVRTRFFRRNGEYWVSTDGPDGKLADYRVAWVFGVYPLQQYLLPMEDGRLQALSIAWDARPADQGGQRWYHLYPDEIIGHDDPLHWTGPYQNWNTRCAECHSTDLHKGYDADTRRFSTTFAEEDVACEACHGAGATHVQRARGNLPAGGADSALWGLRERGNWAVPAGESIARRIEPLASARQVDSCGRCHARRGTLGDYRHGQPLSDTHRLSLLGQPLYHHDGQILDEVYVYGSFVQSRMHAAGVVCSNCHEPHSGNLRATGNGVCTQCHVGAAYDTPDHHRHAADAPGAACVDCHMPARTYMGVDARRDHSMRVPRPDLSVTIGTPNACNDCHTEQTADWSLQQLREWGVAAADTARHPALAMQALQRGDVRGVPRLLELAADEDAAVIWRATALERSAASGSGDALGLAAQLLRSEDPLLRVSAVNALADLPLPERFAQLFPLRDDPVRGVRLAVASALAPVPMEQLDESQRAQLQALFDAYLAVQRQHADMPSVQLQLGLFHLERRDVVAAEAHYREALRINPQLLLAHLNLADLLRTVGREDEAREQLQAALAVAPDSGAALHALGLLEARAGNADVALEYLGRAAALETDGARHRFVYAVAQHDFGDTAAALRSLRDLHRRLPADEQTLLALVNYSMETGDGDAARRYLRRLLDVAPRQPAYRQLAARLGIRE
jgi:Tfp pilus assembly protein PilF